MKNLSISLDNYYDVINFCITEDRQKAKKYIFEEFKMSIGEKSEFVKGYCVQSEGATVIWLPRIPETAFEFGVLYHEVYHAVDFILRKKGVEDRGEPYAYLLGYVIHQFFTLYNPIRSPDFEVFGKKIWIK